MEFDAAFPTLEATESGNLTLTASGLSKREWFAGQALSGLLAMCAGGGVPGPTYDFAARHSVLFADALMDELARTTHGDTTND